MGEVDNPRWNTAWITGASSGIGLELARKMVGRTRHIAVSARSQDKLNALAEESQSIRSYPLDVTDADAVDETLTKIQADCGVVDLVVLNAAAWSAMEMKAFDLDAVRKGIEVNYLGVMNGLHAVLPSMLALGQGHIAIVASTAGYRGLPQSAAYGPTKAALINLAETMRIELAPLGIKVSLICPGFVDTPATQKNQFSMPGIISASEAARAIVSGLEKGQYDIAFPWVFARVMKLLRIIPIGLYFWLVRTFVWRNPTG